MRDLRAVRIAFVLLFFGTLSCASSARVAQQDVDEPPPPPPRFPTQSELAKLSDVPIDVPATPREGLDVESWSLVGPFDQTTTPQPHPAVNQIGKLLVDVATPKGVETSAAMHCVAREIGSFYLEHEKYPAPALEAFIVGRCGAPVISVAVNSFGGKDVGPKFKETDLYGHWRADLQKMVAIANKPDQAAGVWFGRKNKHAAFFLASGPKKSNIAEVVSSTVSKDRFTVRGNVLVSATKLRALINHGSFGVSECEIKSNVSLPDFDVECAADLRDSSAWIEIVAFPPGRILGPSVARILVSPNGAPPNIYSRPRYGLNLQIANKDHVRDHLITAVNRVRADAGLKPVALEPEQSNVAGQVAQHYFAASVGKIDSQIADVVALGVRAGWNVQGLIRYGLFTSAASGIDGNVDDLLSSALERPFGREVLLDPAVQKIAVGPVWLPAEKYFGAIVSTYALFEQESQDRLKKRVFDALTVARAKAGLGAPALLVPFDDVMQKIVVSLEAKQLRPRAALQQMIQHTAQILPGRTIGGWVLESSGIGESPFPQELVTQPGLKISTAIAMYSTPDDPWGRYVVLIVFEAPPPVTTT